MSSPSLNPKETLNGTPSSTRPDTPLPQIPIHLIKTTTTPTQRVNGKRSLILDRLGVSTLGTSTPTSKRSRATPTPASSTRNTIERARSYSRKVKLHRELTQLVKKALRVPCPFTKRAKLWTLISRQWPTSCSSAMISANALPTNTLSRTPYGHFLAPITSAVSTSMVPLALEKLSGLSTYLKTHSWSDTWTNSETSIPPPMTASSSTI